MQELLEILLSKIMNVNIFILYIMDSFGQFKLLKKHIGATVILTHNHKQ